MFYAALQTPSGYINLKCVGIVKLYIFFVLIRGDWIELNRIEVNGYVIRLGIGNAGILVVTRIMDAVVLKKVPATDLQIIGLYPFDIAVP